MINRVLAAALVVAVFIVSGGMGRVDLGLSAIMVIVFAAAGWQAITGDPGAWPVVGSSGISLVGILISYAAGYYLGDPSQGANNVTSYLGCPITVIGIILTVFLTIRKVLGYSIL